MSEYKSCCFTGYRPEKFPFSVEQENENLASLIKNLEKAIENLYGLGVSRFYCGCAKGFDIISGEAVAKLKEKHPEIRLICVEPFPDTAFKINNAWRIRLIKLIELCDRHEVMSDSYGKWAYSKRNRFMVDNADCVVTYYTGGTGGTANTLLYARRRQKPIINLALGETELPAEPQLKLE